MRSDYTALGRAAHLSAFIGLAVSASAQRAPLFKNEIQPVLESRCVKCHGGERKMAGLDLSSFAGLVAGGSGGPVLTPGQPERSLLWKMIKDEKMPPGEKLSAAEKQLIRTYVEQGRFPSFESTRRELEAAKITPEARAWWSFRKPVKPAVPAGGARSAIDAFVAARLTSKGWKMNPEADRPTLIRRAYLDLIGLAPTPSAVNAFVEDQSEAAFDRVVDQLLASPRYGERWGRHWLDVAGYSDSIGDASDREREVAWKYRDYVINSFNKNKPFDQFLTEQLAGDQLVNYDPAERPRPDQLEALIATGFTRMTADITDNQTIYQVDKYFDALQKSTETSLKGFLGLTLGCARCHDHKFDPIPQRDYYQLTAVFQAAFDPENWLASNLSYGPWPSRMLLDMEADQRAAWIKSVAGDDARKRRRDQQVLTATYQAYREALSERRELTAHERQEIDRRIEAAVDLEPAEGMQPRSPSDTELDKLFPDLARRKAELLASRQRERGASIKPNYIMGLWDVLKTPSSTNILQRGNYLAPGETVGPGILSVLDDPRQPFVFPNPAEHPEWKHTGRRLALARWLTQPSHPLTARVFVNRVWRAHFGEGIVRSVEDFGVQGTKPTHPELLDWLAVSFVERGWDVKWLNKQIMLSAAYRQSSTEDSAKLAEDPSNKLLWRKAPLRLEAEVIRDSMLQVSGLLNLEMFGPQVPLVRADDGQWVEDGKAGRGNRRSIYLSSARTRPVGFLRAFDCPDMTSDSQAERFRAALPTQALAMLNNVLARRSAAAFAAQLLERSKGDVNEALREAFEIAYSRRAYPEELEVAAKALAAAGPDRQAGLRLLVQGMFGANDFLYSF